MENEFLERILSEYGLAMLILMVVCVALYRALGKIDKDRKEAWKSNNILVSENNAVLAKVAEALIRIQERLK